MRANVLAFVACVLFIGVAARAGAQASSGGSMPLHGVEPRRYEGPPLSLKDALQQATAANPDLTALRAQSDVVRQRPAQVRALNPPTLAAQIWQWPFNAINPASTNMYVFTLTQDLPGRGKRALREAVETKGVALADGDVAVRAQEIVDQVTQAYTTLFLSREAIEIHVASADLLRQIADVSQAKYEAGRLSQQDVLKATVELSMLHEDVIRFEEQADLAAARLNTLLNRPEDAPIGPLTDAPGEIALPAVADLQRLAVEGQPELRQARLAVEQAEAQVLVVKSDRKPDFTVQGGYMLLPQMTDAWTATLGMTWPSAPWAHSRLDARVAEATAAVGAARAHAFAVESQVRLAVREAYVRAQSARTRAALLRTTILPQAEQVLAVSRAGYESDRVEFQALLDNERRLLDSKLEHVQATSDLAQAMADLERAVGTDLRRLSTGPLSEVN